MKLRRGVECHGVILNVLWYGYIKLCVAFKAVGWVTVNGVGWVTVNGVGWVTVYGIHSLLTIIQCW